MSYKVYFSVKTDWVSCYCWDFLASHQTCRQNCCNCFDLWHYFLQWSCCVAAVVFALHWAFGLWPSHLFGPWSKKTTAAPESVRDGLGPLHAHNLGCRKCCCPAPLLPGGRTMGFCSFQSPEGAKTAAAPRLWCFPKKGKGKFAVFQLLEHLPEYVNCQMQGQDQLLDLSARLCWVRKGHCSAGNTPAPQSLLQLFLKHQEGLTELI